MAEGDVMQIRHLATVISISTPPARKEGESVSTIGETCYELPSGLSMEAEADWRHRLKLDLVTMMRPATSLKSVSFCVSYSCWTLANDTQPFGTDLTGRPPGLLSTSKPRKYRTNKVGNYKGLQLWMESQDSVVEQGADIIIYWSSC